MIELKEPYKKRPIRFLECAEVEGWKVKIYGISVLSEFPRLEFVEAAKKIAAKRLPQPPVEQDRYGIAILIAHEGRDGNFVLVDWWVGENMLQHHVYFASVGELLKFEYVSPSGTIACLWELQVLSFERQAWIESILANPRGPNVDAYLEYQLNQDV